ncbi:hypothetical protein PIB30_006418 [Stylosanthes scabra]|uniref:Uncharacterized protein n=1 Tax=Stylosanthes scabra TaxID=79078 RepID=A0ABU6T430_9FABA|nr:hypothetical protein [Stylosanthes scabra]
MASSTAFAVLLCVALFALSAAAQDLSPASSPAPSPDAGAAGAVSGSAAMMVASLVVSMLAVIEGNKRDSDMILIV